ncbi:MAG: hypothetical protein AB7S26_22890 [Sandaracinaceae bacterium]
MRRLSHPRRASHADPAPGTGVFDEAFPLVLFCTPPLKDDRAIEKVGAAFERVWARRAPYTVLSFNLGDPPTAAERQRIGAWAASDAVREAAGRWCVGSATAVPNAVYRGALTAIFWIVRPNYPHEAVASIEEGIDHCLQKLVEEGIETPHSIETLRRMALARVRLERAARNLGATA